MKRRLGFTLIELLVVIAIIAVLAAILFPVFSEAKKRAQMNSCLSNLKQISFAFQQYRSDYNDTMPSLSSYLFRLAYHYDLADWCGSESVNQPAYPRKGQLWPYTKNYGVYLCPVDYKKPTGNPSVPATVMENFPLSYSVNGMLHMRKFDATVGKRPSKMLFIIHESRNTINDGYYGFDSGHDKPSVVHYEGTTVCYCDGHGKYRTNQELDAEKLSGAWEP